MNGVRRPARVRISADISPELMHRLNEAFEASKYKTRNKFIAELLQKYLSEQL
jgi:metal-responsive CopG/Arc/MetJ family transcriptional regulator